MSKLLRDMGLLIGYLTVSFGATYIAYLCGEPRAVWFIEMISRWFE